MQILKYQSAVITYVDVLGFKELIESESPGHISKILRLLREVAEPDPGSKYINRIVFRNFSDLIVRYVPLETVSNRRQPTGLLFSELLSLVHAQAKLIDEGIILRGGVTVGLIRSSKGVTYGPGLVRAYELEKASKYPRILLDPNIFDFLRENPLLRLYDFETEKAEIAHLVYLGKTRAFIDYLGGISSEFDYPETGYIELLKAHRKLIRQKMSEHHGDPHIYRKYRWLMAYHNHTIRQMYRDGFFEQRGIEQKYIDPLMA